MVREMVRELVHEMLREMLRGQSRDSLELFEWQSAEDSLTVRAYYILSEGKCGLRIQVGVHTHMIYPVRIVVCYEDSCLCYEDSCML